MKTTEEVYTEYICSICKNKKADLCCIRRKIDNTMYCRNYDSDIIKKKKTPAMWQEW